MQNKSANIYRYWVLWADLLFLNAIFYALMSWRFPDLATENPSYYNYYLQLWVLANVSWLAVGQWRDIYAFSSGIEQRIITSRFLQAAIGQLIVLAFFMVGLKGYYYSRFFIVVLYSGFFSAALVFRWLMVLYIRRQTAAGKWQRPFVLVGSHETSTVLIETLRARPDLGWTLEAEVEDALPGATATNDWSDDVEVLCALPPNHSAYVAWQQWAAQKGRRFRYVPNMGSHYAGQMQMETIEGVPIFSDRKEPLSHPINAFLKRVIDFVLSSLLIVGLLSWAYLLLLVLYKLSGMGKVVFTQERSGHNTASFTVLKFTTMNARGESNGLQRWMRKTGVDELLQLINVWRGHMSLVGPRPHTAGDDETYGAQVEQYRIRHWAKPGMTGLAQVRGLRGGGASAQELQERIKADIYYVENWSLLLDSRILLETFVRTIFVPSTLHTDR